MSSISDLFTVSVAALTAVLLIPRCEQNLLCNIHIKKGDRIDKVYNRDQNYKKVRKSATLMTYIIDVNLLHAFLKLEQYDMRDRFSIHGNQ
jgi:hypothetical protein